MKHRTPKGEFGTIVPFTERKARLCLAGFLLFLLFTFASVSGQAYLDPGSVATVPARSSLLTPASTHKLTAASVLSSTLTPDSLVQEMIDRVSPSAVTHYNGALSGEWPVLLAGIPYTLSTRYTDSEEIWRATEYVGERLAEEGLAVRYHQWEVGKPPNVIGEIRGEASGQPIYIVSAHLDSRSEIPYLRAPGADDNASGSAAVLVAADILSDYPWQCTLRFALWTGEEQGLLGSDAYATEAAARGEVIAGVLNLDMIGYNSDSEPVIDLHARSDLPGAVSIANLFADVVETYALDLAPAVLLDEATGHYSDNAAFWAQGYPAILAIEDRNDFTPYYHSSDDTLATLDHTYYTEAVRAAVATFAHMTNCYGSALPQGTLEGKVSGEEGVAVAGATITMRQADGPTFTTRTGAGGFYSVTAPAGTYEVNAAAPAYEMVTVPEMTIIAGEVVIRDFALALCPSCLPRLYLPFLRVMVIRSP